MAGLVLVENDSPLPVLSMRFKQKSLQEAFGFWSKAWVFALVCASCIGVAAPRSADAQKLPTSADQVSRLRLLAAPGPVHGTYDAGIEIAMAPGSHTYWKIPGEAGVPPVFAFNGSRNVAAARVLFPAPVRITEDALDAYGYVDRVTFPVVVTPADPSKEAVLAADVTYAVCNKICIPAHATATLTLAPGTKGDEGAAVKAALAAVPRPAPADARAALSIKTDMSAPKPSWTLTWGGKAPIDDIFAEAPEGYYFSTRKRGPATWTLTAEQTVATPSAKPVPVALTLARKTESLVVTESLDAATATR